MDETTIQLSERAKRMADEAQSAFKRASEKRLNRRALSIGIGLLLVATALSLTAVVITPLWAAERIHISSLNLSLIPSIFAVFSFVVPLHFFWQYRRARSESKYLSYLATALEDELIEIQNQ